MKQRCIVNAQSGQLHVQPYISHVEAHFYVYGTPTLSTKGFGLELL